MIESVGKSITKKAVMKLTSTQRPVLTDTQECHIGKYGRMYHAYLKGHQPSLDRTLKLTENVFPFGRDQHRLLQSAGDH